MIRGHLLQPLNMSTRSRLNSLNPEKCPSSLYPSITSIHPLGKVPEAVLNIQLLCEVRIVSMHRPCIPAYIYPSFERDEATQKDESSLLTFWRRLAVKSRLSPLSDAKAGLRRLRSLAHDGFPTRSMQLADYKHQDGLDPKATWLLLIRFWLA